MHWLTEFAGKSNQEDTDINFALHAFNVYPLLFVCKVCHLKRTILSWEMDLIFFMYSIMEMLLHYETLLEG